MRNVSRAIGLSEGRIVRRLEEGMAVVAGQRVARQWVGGSDIAAAALGIGPGDEGDR